MYQVVFQCLYVPIHHFIKKGIKVFPKTLWQLCKIVQSSEVESNGVHEYSPLGRWYR